MSLVRTAWHARIHGSLKTDLEALRPQLAQAANKIIEEWTQDDEGMDDMVGTGGVCDEVSQAMGSVIPWDTHEGGAEGDDHSWLIVVRGEEVVGVDIPPGVYETGGGYNWTKLEDHRVEPHHVEIFEMDIPASEFEDDY